MTFTHTANDGKRFIISFFNNKRDNKPKEKLLTWLEFVAHGEKPIVRREKDGELFAPCLFEPKHRKKDNVKSVCMAVFDIDHSGELKAIRSSFEKLSCAFLIHTSHSHLRVTNSNPNAEPRYRVCLPLSEDVPAANFPQLWQCMKKATGQPFDEAAKDASRIFYLPSIAEPDAPYAFHENKGDFLNWQALLKRMQPEMPQNGHKPTQKQVKNATNLKSFYDIEIKIDPTATIPADAFEALQDNIPKFKATWNRTRKDLPDQTGSSYDMTLANMAVGAGLDDQTVCNLLIWHRRKHSDEKLRLDYLQRTIVEARSGNTFQVDASDERPQLNAGDQNLERSNKEAWTALIKANNPPLLFRYGSLPFRLESDDNNEPVLRELNESRTAYELARAAIWYKTTAKGKMPANPSQGLIKSILATPNMPLPVLNRIVTSPIFAGTGELQLQPGYHAASRTFYHKVNDFCLPAVSKKPTSENVEQARALIFEMLADFPFIGQSDKCHAVALLLLPFTRELINGATPLHSINAPSPGTGKSLLAEVLSIPSTLDAAKMTEGGSDEEWRKRITAALRSCPSFLVIDNVQQPLNTSQLAAAITSQTWTDRILGKSEILRLPVRCVWATTGNNIVFSKEMARRTVQIALDAKTDRAWLRENFAKKDLRAWVIANRDHLIWAALTLISAWLAEGKPLSNKSLGMFENWAAVMGGIMSVAGIDGFLDNLHEFYEQADTESEIWRAFVENWWHCYGKKQIGVGELWNIAISIMDGEFFELGSGSERSQRIRLGQLLVKARDRQIGDFRVKRAGELRRAQLWALEWTGEGELPETKSISNSDGSDLLYVNDEFNIHTN